MWGALRQAFASGGTVSVDEMYVPLRGSGPDQALQDRWFKYVVRALKDEAGQTTGLMVAAIDVTPQVLARRAIEEARREAERYQAMLASAQRAATIGIFDWDVRSGRVQWSPELYALLGLQPGELEATTENWSARLHPDDVASGWRTFREAVTQRSPATESEHRMRLPDGRLRWIRVSNHITYDDASGEPLRVIGAVIDIQNLRELIERERAARAEAEEANRAVRLPALDAGPPLALAGERRQPELKPKALRVLVVDDNQDAAEMLSEALQLLGYETATAHDGPEALRVADEFRPDTALLDIGLPVMDGYELAQRLRSQFGRELTLIAITGYGQESDRLRSQAAGCQHHFTKPVDLQKLAESLARMTPRTDPAGGAS